MIKTIAIDLETSPVPRHLPWHAGSYLTSVGLYTPGWPKVKTYLFTHDDNTTPEYAPLALEEMFNTLTGFSRIVAHNMAFEYNWLRSLGSRFEGLLKSKRLYCTQEAEYLIRGQSNDVSYSLHDTGERYGILPKIDNIKAFWQSGYETKEIPWTILKPYMEQDVYNAMAIFQRQVPELKKRNLVAQVGLQMEKVRVLADIENNGMSFDLGKAKEYARKMREKVDTMDEEIVSFGWPGFNPGSSDDLSLILYGGTRKYKEQRPFLQKNGKTVPRWYDFQEDVKGLGLKPPKGSELAKEGFYSTDKNVLKLLKPTSQEAKSFLNLLKTRGKEAKRYTSFVGKSEGAGLIAKVQSDGKLHPRYNSTTTRTGRLSSSEPNGQNLDSSEDSPVKDCIVPPRWGWEIFNGDLSSLEWVAVADLSGCQAMIKEILAGVDPHERTANEFFSGPNDRKLAKIFNFRFIYGGTAYSFFMDPSMPSLSLKKWNDIIQETYDKYPGMKQWHQENIEIVNKTGELTTPTQRWFPFTKDKKGEYRAQQIKNYPVQSFATADCAQIALVLISKRLQEANAETYLIGQVHDSIVATGPKEERDMVAEIMIKSFQDIPRYLKAMFGYTSNLPYTGTFEYGPTYAQLNPLK